MEEGYKVMKSGPQSLRLPMDLFNFLAQKAKENNNYNEKGRPNVVYYVLEKCMECFKNGWDTPTQVNNEGINLKTRSEILAEMGLIHEEAERYRYLCQVIEKKSHNGLKFYMKEVDKLLATKKQLLSNV